MASRVSLIQSRSIYVGTSNAVAPSDGNLIVTGNVGIGTTSPESKLHVAGGQLTLKGGAPTDQQIVFNFAREYVNGIYNSSGHFRLQDNSLGGTVYQWDGSSFCFPNGNVGIGTTSPTSKLTIKTNNRSFADGENAIRIEYPGSPAPGEIGGGIVFSQYWYNLSTEIVRTGGIYGVKNGGDGAYGGGLAFYTQPNSADPMVERMRITQDGNVGIGTTSPTSKFTVTNGNVEIQSNGASSMTNYLKIATHTNGSWGSFIAADSYYNSTLSTNLTLGVSNAGSALNVLHITSAGNVGIGTTSPTQLLSVAGNTDLGNSIGSATSSTYTTRLSGYALYYDASNRYGNYGVLLLNADSGWTSSAKRFMITNGYNANRFAIIRSVDATTDPALGYGGSVTSGTVDFEINSAGAATFGSSVTTVGAIQSGGDIIIQNTYPRIQLIDTDHNSDFAIINNNGNFSIYDDTNSSHRLWIDSTGNVGIGTTSPGARLHVLNSASPYQVSFQSDTSNVWSMGAGKAGYYQDWFLINSGTSDIIRINNSYTQINNALYAGTNFRIDTNGDAYQLTTGGVALWAATANATYPSYGFYGDTGIGMYRAAADTLAFSTSDTERLRITAAGNVGIGTTSPNDGKLQVFSNSSSNWGIYAFNQNTNGIGLHVETNSYGTEQLLRLSSLSGAGGTNTVKMVVRADGNVGIGTTSPGYKLDVSSDTNDGNIIRSTNLNAGAAASARFYAENNIGSLGQLTTYSSGFGFTVFDLAAGNFSALLSSGASSAGLLIGSLTSSPVVFGTNNTERMRITSGGNVGIGTTAPTAKLHVVGNGEFTDTLVVSKGASDTVQQGSSLYLIGGSGASYTQLQQGVGRFIIFGFNGSGWVERFTINNTSGNVGIGTTSPSYKLQVNSDAGGYGIVNTNGTVTIGTYIEGSNNYASFGTQSNHGLGFFTNNAAPQMYINTAGNVGIGTTSPAVSLQVNASTAAIRLEETSASSKRLEFSIDSSAVAKISANQSSQSIAFETAGSERMRIASTGNVGIGTTSPGARLSIQNSGTTDSIISEYRMTNGSNAATFRTDDNVTFGIHSQNSGDIYIKDTSDNVLFYGKNGGNVGIGTTSPSEKLHVDGNVIVTYNNSFQGINSIGNKAILARVSPTTGIINYAEYATATNLNGFVLGSDDARVKGDIATDSLDFITNTSSRMFINSSGNVGIGTTSPSYKLDVVGDSRITSGSLGVGVAPNATDGRIDASNDIVAYSSSDRRLKENITPIANALDKVKSLTGVEFDWKPEHKKAHGYEGHDTGVIAQEVQEVMPTAVRTNNTGYLAVRYEKLIGLLIEANKELAARVEELEKKLK